MTHQVDCFLIVRDEEELLQYCLESFESIVDLVGLVSVVDNGSTDATMDILDSFRTRLPLRVIRDVADSHHGRLRSRALEPLTAPWIYYLDADETHSKNMRDWMANGAMEEADIWDFFKHSAIVDRYHYTENGGGPATRLFRNLPGVYFPQLIHTYPTHPGLQRKREAQGVFLFENSACKSEEARWAKGYRYRFAFDQRVPGVGSESEYIMRNNEAIRLGTSRELDEAMKTLVFTGP